jgi:RimJ/RimL family protein N-acetyltransferase
MELIHLHAAIDPGNSAARQVLKEHGFTVVGNDDQGYLEYAKHKHY